MSTTRIDSVALRYAGAAAIGEGASPTTGASAGVAPSVALVGTTTPEPAQAVQKPSSEQVMQAAEAMNAYVSQHRSDLQFRMDDSSGQVVISVIDNESGEVLRQIPSEAVLRVARQITELGWGLAEDRA